MFNTESLNRISINDSSKNSISSRIQLTLDLLLLAVSDRKRVGFSLILLCKNRFGFRSELAKSKKSIHSGFPITEMIEQTLDVSRNSILFLLIHQMHSQSDQWQEILLLALHPLILIPLTDHRVYVSKWRFLCLLQYSFPK